MIDFRYYNEYIKFISDTTMNILDLLEIATYFDGSNIQSTLAQNITKKVMQKYLEKIKRYKDWWVGGSVQIVIFLLLFLAKHFNICSFSIWKISQKRGSNPNLKMFALFIYLIQNIPFKTYDFNCQNSI